MFPIYISDSGQPPEWLNLPKRQQKNNFETDLCMDCRAGKRLTGYFGRRKFRKLPFIVHTDLNITTIATCKLCVATIVEWFYFKKKENLFSRVMNQQ